MVRIVFQLDGGKVDHLMQVYTGTNPPFDTVMPVQELPSIPHQQADLVVLRLVTNAFTRSQAMVMVRTIYMFCRLETSYPYAIGTPIKISFLRREDRRWLS